MLHSITKQFSIENNVKLTSVEFSLFYIVYPPFNPTVCRVPVTHSFYTYIVKYTWCVDIYRSVYLKSRQSNKRVFMAKKMVFRGMWPPHIFRCFFFLFYTCFWFLAPFSLLPPTSTIIHLPYFTALFNLHAQSSAYSN